MNKKKVISYGPTMDETIIVETLMDELRFVKCMKLYKTHGTMELLDKAIADKSLKKINNAI